MSPNQSVSMSLMANKMAVKCNLTNQRTLTLSVSGENSVSNILTSSLCEIFNDRKVYLTTIKPRPSPNSKPKIPKRQIKKVPRPLTKVQIENSWACPCRLPFWVSNSCYPLWLILFWYHYFASLLNWRNKFGAKNATLLSDDNKHKSDFLLILMIVHIPSLVFWNTCDQTRMLHRSWPWSWSGSLPR